MTLSSFTEHLLLYIYIHLTSLTFSFLSLDYTLSLISHSALALRRACPSAVFDVPMLEKKLTVTGTGTAMAMATEKGRKPGLITKTLGRCRGARRRSRPPAPEGCFAVRVGAGRQRFVVRTECVNHPLFRALLEEAEEAFGYAAAGPLVLPCDADAFVRVLEQIQEEEEDAAGQAAPAVARCGLVRGHSAYRLLLVPARPLLVGRS
jgi:SAUR family protein